MVPLLVRPKMTVLALKPDGNSQKAVLFARYSRYCAAGPVGKRRKAIVSGLSLLGSYLLARSLRIP
jgi:hypothetical protein